MCGSQPGDAWRGLKKHFLLDKEAAQNRLPTEGEMKAVRSRHEPGLWASRRGDTHSGTGAKPLPGNPVAGGAAVTPSQASPPGPFDHGSVCQRHCLSSLPKVRIALLRAFKQEVEFDYWCGKILCKRRLIDKNILKLLSTIKQYSTG